MDPPADGDELARVVPLRRRGRDLAAAPGARGTLPRERAPFDPELEPLDTPARAARGVGLQRAHPAFRLRPLPRRRDGTRADVSQRLLLTVLLTGAGGVALVAVGALALFGSTLIPSPHSPAATVGGRVAALALQPNTSGVLSASANPFNARLATATRTTEKTLAPRSHRALSKPSRKRSSPARPATHASTTTTHHSAVAASYTPDTSGTSSHNGTADTQHPEITTSTPSPVQTARPQQSTSVAQPASSAAPLTNRPNFGEQGLLGPGSSPDS